MEQDTERKRKEKGKTSLGLIIGAALAVVILVFCCVGAVGYANRHTFTQERWLEQPGSRAKMTDDLFADYELVGMTEQQILELLGPNDNLSGYFQKENRYVYYLGEERTIMDSEWLLLDFVDGVVAEYSIVQD